ncbi:MAG: FAD-dependent monooxygenase [Berryella intestinalis]|uniref:FAD-dependent monooxygenase n=1 Tax=Berryella intestinalis TaxID=1531429 RepID=UPI002A74A4ED|nr:FAD-dependent monooxygenase [Berryella intestinalis]MDY3128699.1 FAD-dependent monooxygenase [Berryella intestinalis]
MVAGHGYAGLTACRELAESGARVVLIERQAEDTYAPVGNEGAALNATILQQRGVLPENRAPARRAERH